MSTPVTLSPAVVADDPRGPRFSSLLQTSSRPRGADSRPALRPRGGSLTAPRVAPPRAARPLRRPHRRLRGGAAGRGRRRRSTGCSRSRGMTAHDRVESVLMAAKAVPPWLELPSAGFPPTSPPLARCQAAEQRFPPCRRRWFAVSSYASPQAASGPSLGSHPDLRPEQRGKNNFAAPEHLQRSKR